MARFTRLQVINDLLSTGLIPLFFEKDAQLALAVVKACQEGGAHIVEFTNRGDFAWKTFGELESALAQGRSPVILGAGTIDDAPTAAIYIASGANFIVSPSFNVEVARLCNRRKIPYFPGCATLTEIATAEEWGAEICKIFPAQEVGGPAFIKAVLGPRPWSRLMPTGGVSPTRESISAWIEAGASCLGMGSNLISKPRVKEGNFAAISADIRRSVAWIQEARSPAK